MFHLEEEGKQSQNKSAVFRFGFMILHLVCLYKGSTENVFLATCVTQGSVFPMLAVIMKIIQIQVTFLKPLVL